MTVIFCVTVQSPIISRYSKNLKWWKGDEKKKALPGCLIQELRQLIQSIWKVGSESQEENGGNYGNHLKTAQCTLILLLILDWEVNKYGFSLHNKIQNENLDFKIRKDLQQEEDLILSWMRLFLCFSNTVK